ncbi:MAG: globin [Deltaproteobacteria bacterium]|nr:globin [Deltaproteobacteria bacterium]
MGELKPEHSDENTNPVMASFEKCVTTPGFLNRFYEIFLVSHPAMPTMFSKTDFKTQINMLQQGLHMAMLYGQGIPYAVPAINRIQDSHSKKKLNVFPALYPYWIDSLMEAVAEFDPNLTPELEAQWREALKPALDHIKKGY